MKKQLMSVCGTAVLAAALGLSPVFVACDKYDDSGIQQQIDDINTRLDELENSLRGQVDALSAMLQGKATVASCTLDEQTGLYTIVLSDGKTITVPSAGSSSLPLLTFIEENGQKYWATVGADGVKTVITDASGNKVGVASVPAIRVNESGEWEVSVNGKWTGLGVTSENVSIFAKVKETDTEVIFTLADGTEVSVDKFDESKAEFIPLSGKQYFKAGETKTVELVSEGITSVATLEKPEGWKVVSGVASLKITAPAADKADADQSGIVKVLGVTSDGKSFISEIPVAIGTADIDISVIKGAETKVQFTYDSKLYDDYSWLGYYYGAVPADGFSLSALADRINADTSASPTLKNISTTLRDLLGSEPVIGTSYIIYAVSSYDGKEITASDIVYSMYQPASADIELTECRFDKVSISVTLKGAETFYGGFFIDGENGQQTLEEELAAINAGNTPSNGAFFRRNSYSGSLGSYGTEFEMAIGRGKTYIVYALPVVDGKTYTIDDLTTIKVTVPEILMGGDLETAVELQESDFEYVYATVNSPDAYKIFAQFITDADMEKYPDDEALFTFLTGSNAMNHPASIMAGPYSAGTSGTIAAVAVTEDGLAGPITKMKASTKTIEYSDITVEVDEQNTEVGMNNIALAYKETGGEIVTWRYIHVNKSDWEMNPNFGYGQDDAKVESYLISGKAWEATDVTAPSDNIFRFDGLSIGTSMVFFGIGIDAEGKFTHYIKYEYTPEFTGSVMRQSDDRWSDGKPTITILKEAEGIGLSDVKFTVTPGEGCAEYYVEVCDPVYVPTNYKYGAIYVISNGDRYTGAEEIYRDLITVDMKIYITWKDSKSGMWHEVISLACGDPSTGEGGEEGGDTGEGGDIEER